MKTKIGPFFLSPLFLLILANPQLEGFLIASPQGFEAKAQDNTFIPFKKYSREEDEKILKLYEGLRVAQTVWTW
jgi:hypothetical protein